MKHLKTRWLVCCTAILLMLSGGQRAWGKSSDIDAAVEQYREGYFQEAKEQMEKIAARSGDEESAKTALTYMALIELAFRNPEGADTHLKKLLSADPFFDIGEIEDVTPDLSNRFEKIRATIDTLPPSASISGIEDTYTEGETIRFTLEAEDNAELDRIVFEINETSVKQAWYVSGDTVRQKSSFSTSGWAPGTYTYRLLVEDRTENVKEYTGTFELIEPPDTIPPEGTVDDLERVYHEGDTVTLNLEARDDRELKEMRFAIGNTDVEKRWELSNNSAVREFSFSTEGWKTGTHDYTYTVTDRAGNPAEYTGSFTVKPRQYGYLNLITRPWTTVYVDGKSFGNTPLARLKLPAGRVEIRFVNPEKNVDVMETIEILPDEIVRKRFEWK